MAIVGRLRRLESVVSASRKPALTSFERVVGDMVALSAWLEGKGYEDAISAVEAGEAGPQGLRGLLLERAGDEARHQAWARVEAALNAGRLPTEADLRLVTGSE